MYKEIGFCIKSASPLLMHNGKKLTNPLNPLTKQIKQFSGKRNKTDEDLMALAKLEWLGGLYLMEEAQIEIERGNVRFIGGKQPCIPGDLLEGVLINGAKKNKLGTQFKSGILVDNEYPLIYDGPVEPEKLFTYNDGEFADSRNVRVQKNAIVRCRPFFKEWSVRFIVKYLPSVVNADQIREALEVAGLIVGICDYRPKYGRFHVA